MHEMVSVDKGCNECGPDSVQIHGLTEEYYTQQPAHLLMIASCQIRSVSL